MAFPRKGERPGAGGSRLGPRRRAVRSTGSPPEWLDRSLERGPPPRSKEKPPRCARSLPRAGEQFLDLRLDLQRSRVPSPGDPPVAIDQEGGRHAGDRVGRVRGGGRAGRVLRAPEVPDGPQAVLTDVPAELVAVLVDADRDERHLVLPRLAAAPAERGEALDRLAARS